MSSVNGRMCSPGLFSFTMIGAVVSPAAVSFDPTIGFWIATITGLSALVTFVASYTLTIRIPTEDEIKELLDEQRD